MAKVALVMAILVAAAALAAAINHTVGGPNGWFFDDLTDRPSTNFSAWAANQTFALGDFLIFNTDSNHTIIHTYNETMYLTCEDDDEDIFPNNTWIYSTGMLTTTPVSIVVPLMVPGKQFFFADDADKNDADDDAKIDIDGECEDGMKFAIMVSDTSSTSPASRGHAQAPVPIYGESAPGTEQRGTSTRGTSFFSGVSSKNMAARGVGALILSFSCLGFLL